VTAAMHGGSSLYALDDEKLEALEPDLILTQELCRVCAVSYREVNEVARAIDAIDHRRLARADVDRGDPQHDHHGRRDGRGRGRRARPRRDRCAQRLGAVEEVVTAGATPATVRPRRRGRMARSRLRVGHWVPEQIRGPAAGTSSAAMASTAVQTTWDAVARGRPGDAGPDAVRLPPAGDRRAEWDATPRRTAWSCRPSAAARCSRSTARPISAGRAAGHRRHRAPRRDLRPDAFVDSARPAAGPRSRPDARAVPRDVRLPVVRDRAHVPRRRRHRGLGAALPDCVGKAGDNGFSASGLRDAITERVGRARRAGGHAVRDRETPRRTTSWSRTTRPGRPSTTTGICARVATTRARSTTRRGTPSSTPPGAGSTACRSRADRRARRRHRLVVAVARRQGRAVDLRRAEAPLDAPATGCSPTAARATSTRATRGPSRTGRSTPCSPASG
jgi:hypothetical protein